MEAGQQLQRTYTIEMDEDTYMMMKKVMTSYCESINVGRKKKRTEQTKPQKRTMEDMVFKYKILQ